VVFTDQAYATWRTLGVVMIQATDKEVSQEIDTLAPGLQGKPTVAWYSPHSYIEGILIQLSCSATELVANAILAPLAMPAVLLHGDC
jgi:hypothetical protein